MARKHSKSMKKRTHKRRQRGGKSQRGGGWGFTGASSIPGVPGTVSNPQVFTGIGDCRAVRPGYDIPTSNYGPSLKGLPGMSGGTRRSGKGKRTRKHRQRGGRYGFFPEGDPNANGQAWWAGSYAPIQRIACEGTTQNPLNPTHTGSSAPPGAASPNYYLNPKIGLMSGGAQQMAPATYGVGNVDSMYYYAPTGGYANNASTWVDSVGAPVQIQVPYAARAMNQACLSTGGHLPLTGALQKGGYDPAVGVPDNENNTNPPLPPANAGPMTPANQPQVPGPGSGAGAGPGPLPLRINIPPRRINFGNSSSTPNGNNGNPPLGPVYGPPTRPEEPEVGGSRKRKHRKNRTKKGGGLFNKFKELVGFGATAAATAAPTFPNEMSSMINLTKPGTPLTNAQKEKAKNAAKKLGEQIFSGLPAPSNGTNGQRQTQGANGTITPPAVPTSPLVVGGRRKGKKASRKHRKH